MSAPDPFLLELFQGELEINIPLLAATVSGAPDWESALRAAGAVRAAAKITGLKSLDALAGALESAFTDARSSGGPMAAHPVEATVTLLRDLAALAPESIVNAIETRHTEIDGLCTSLDSRGGGFAAAAPVPPPSESTADTSLLELFCLEVESNVTVIEDGLVGLEKGATPELLEELMRAAHSMKGAARLIGLDGVVKLAHTMEELMVAAQKGQRRLEPRDIDALLGANDFFRDLSRTDPDQLEAMVTGRASQITRLIAGIEGQAVEPVTTPAPAPAPQPAAAGRADRQAVRVNAETLSRLITRSGEMLIRTNSLTSTEQRLRELKQAAGVEGHTGMQEQIACILEEFSAQTLRLEQLAGNIHDDALSCRMQPFADALEGLSRMVREVARMCGKEAQLQVEGERTRVDRDILEMLKAPLNHLVRNAIDHGLETPEERAAAGKAPEGQIFVEARHHGGMLRVTISDDGGGIGREKLRRSIADRGLVTAEAAAAFSDAELFNFLFLPGFSTRADVTEISGRGVGLDVVQQMIRTVGGSLRVESVEGKGATFTMSLPLAISILRCLLVEIAGELYALPLSRMDRVMPLEQLGEDAANAVHAQEIFGLAKPQMPARRQFVITLSDALNRYNVIVDRLAGRQDLVISPLPSILDKVPVVNGAAILDDGRPVLLIDVDDAVRAIHNLLTSGTPVTASSARRQILVVDDSATVRATEERILKHAGYRVTTAMDGMEAWNTLQTQRFDLIVSDIDMPRLDGMELSRRVRANPATASVPVLLISYRDSADTEMAALAAGANRFMTKGSFEEQSFLRTVADLLPA